MKAKTKTKTEYRLATMADLFDIEGKPRIGIQFYRSNNGKMTDLKAFTLTYDLEPESIKPLIEARKVFTEMVWKKQGYQWTANADDLVSKSAGYSKADRLDPWGRQINVRSMEKHVAGEYCEFIVKIPTNSGPLTKAVLKVLLNSNRK